MRRCWFGMLDSKMKRHAKSFLGVWDILFRCAPVFGGGWAERTGRSGVKRRRTIWKDGQLR